MQDATRSRPMAAWYSGLLALVTCLCAAHALGATISATVTGINQVSTTRVGRTTYDYVYTIAVTNGATAVTGASAVVTSSNPNTVVVQGTVALGSLGANAKIISTNTFTILQDRTFAFDPTSLHWTVSGTPATTTVQHVGGTLTGLTTGNGVVLQDNGGDNLTLTANGHFTFSTPLASAASYRVTVLTQPNGEVCSVANGTGAIASADVTNVAVSCATTVTSGSTAFSALAIGNSRIAMVPLNLTGSSSPNDGVQAILIDGPNKLSGTFVKTSFPIEACTTDSASLLSICINYNSTLVAVLDLSKFATTFNVADIIDREYDTGVPLSATAFSGANCLVCGAVAVSNLKSFVISAFDGYRVYAYPAAAANSPLKPTKIYNVPITENFTVSTAHNWLVSADYYPTFNSTRPLRVIDLVGQTVYTWTSFTDKCSSNSTPCVDFAEWEVDAATYSDDTNLVTLVSEAGSSQLTIDMTQAVFNKTAGTFSAPSAFADFSVVTTLGLGEMSGILASSVGHWGMTVEEFGSATVGVQKLPASAGTGGTVTVPAPNPIYLLMSSLTDVGSCPRTIQGGLDPHAQGYTLTAAGVPLGLVVSGDSTCVGVINFATLSNAPRQTANPSLVDLSSYDPVKAGAVNFFPVTAAFTAVTPAAMKAAVAQPAATKKIENHVRH